MKVEIIRGTVNNGVKTFVVGEMLDINNKEAESLIALGIVKKSGGGKDEASPVAPSQGGASGENANAGGGKK